jgi:hypothetical protein
LFGISGNTSSSLKDLFSPDGKSAESQADEDGSWGAPALSKFPAVSPVASSDP